MGWLRQTGRVLLRVEDTPTRVALAFGIGVFIAFFPVIGIHTLVALGLAFAFRLNRVAIVAGAWTNNPWTIAPMFTAGTLVGCALLGVSPASLAVVDWSLHGRAFYRSLVAGVSPLVAPFVVGNLVLGGIAAVLAFVVLRAVLVRRRREVRAAAPSPPS
jgi:uncharacterized protein (DUF2062 family)